MQPIKSIIENPKGSVEWYKYKYEDNGNEKCKHK